MTYTANHLMSRFAVQGYIHDPADATVATKIAWVEIPKHFLGQAVVISGAFVTVKVFAATSSAGAGAVEVAACTAPTTADAAGDSRNVEVTAEQCRAALSGATHLSVEIDMNGASDTCAVIYMRDGVGPSSMFRYDGITADVTS